MIQRSFNGEDMKQALQPYPELISEDFDFDEWMENENNIALKEEDSLGLFTYEYFGVYSGHYFFTVRGKKALELAREMLNEVFRNHGARVVRGLIKIENKPSRWMTRQVGATSLGIVEAHDGDYELFCLTVDEYYHTLSMKDK